jgi:hypothetical protein
MESGLRRFTFGAILLVLLPFALCAQAVSGTILGTVQDSSGAAVPGAAVTVAAEKRAILAGRKGPALWLRNG